MKPLDAPSSPIVRLRHHLRLRVVDGEGAYLVSERDVTVLEGQLAVALATRIDGTLTLDEIVSDMIEDFPGDRVRHAIDKLVSSGIVVIEQPHQNHALAGDSAFYEMGGIDLSTAALRLAAATVAIHVVGDVE